MGIYHILDVLETPLSEEEVRLLCEERWQDIKMLLQQNAKFRELILGCPECHRTLMALNYKLTEKSS